MAGKAGKSKGKKATGGAPAARGAVTDLEALVKLIQGRLDGTIEAEPIGAEDGGDGLEWIAPGQVRDVADLRFRVTELEQEIRRNAPRAELLKAGQALSRAKQELQEPQPDNAKVVKSLQKATRILSRAAEAAEAAGRLGDQLVRWTVGAAGLWQLAAKVLGE